MAIKKNGSLNIGPGFSPNSLAYWDSAIEQWQSLEVGIEGAILVSNGPDAAPAWVPIGDISGVVSVGLTAPAALFSVTGSPVINSGTLGLSLNAQNAGQVFAGPTTGAPAAPAFRALVSSDLPSISSRLDGLGAGVGDIAYRGVAGWTVLPPGSAGSVLTTGGNDAAPSWTFIGGTGTVTSVGLSIAPTLFSVTGSPVVDHGTLTASLNNQNAHWVFAGPNGDAAGMPGFRQLVVADMPGMSPYLDTIAATRGDILYRGAAGWTALAPGTAGQFLISGGAGNDPSWSNSGAGGTVSSVGLSLPASVFNVTGSPVTTSGTLTGTLASQFANQVFAGPVNGSAAAPGFRALTTADLPALGPQLDTISNVQGSILYRSASGWVALPPGAAGQFLETQGASANPQWATPTGGTVTSVGLTAPAIFSVSGSPVVGAGTLDFELVNQTARTFWGGPVSGSPSVPSFRSIEVNDLPAASSYLDTVSATQGAVLYRSATGWTTLAPGTPGSVLTTGGAGANLSWTNSSGTVTSVGISMPGGFTVTGSPVVGSGTLNVGFANEPAGFVLIGPTSGTARAPSWRALVASDLPAGYLDTIGSTQGDVLYRSATGWAVLAPGTAGNVLSTGGAGANPSWVAPPSGVSSAAFDSAFGTTKGAMLIRDASSNLWTLLNPGATAGQVLTSNGTDANPSWATPSGSVSSAALDTAFGAAVGGVLVRGTAGWTNLGAGTAGQVLTTGGASANPSWTTPQTSFSTIAPNAVSTTFTFASSGAAQAQLYDGNDATPAADPAGINASTSAAYDLGAAYAIANVRAITAATTGWAAASVFNIQYSDTGLTGPWTTAGSLTIQAGTAKLTNQAVNQPTTGAHRYWRIAYASGTTGGNAWLGELSFQVAGSAPGQLPGTATNDNASAGNVGEYISSSLATVTAAGNGTTTNVTSVLLTAGDWEVSGFAILSTASSSQTAYNFGAFLAGASNSVGTNDANGLGNNTWSLYSSGSGQALSSFTLPVGPRRVSLAASARQYLNAACLFVGSGLPSFQGVIRARRVR